MKTNESPEKENACAKCGAPSPYKCPKCKEPYCSVVCGKSHKCAQVAIAPPSGRLLELEPEKNIVPNVPANSAVSASSHTPIDAASSAAMESEAESREPSSNVAALPHLKPSEVQLLLRMTSILQSHHFTHPDRKTPDQKIAQSPNLTSWISEHSTQRTLLRALYNIFGFSLHIRLVPHSSRCRTREPSERGHGGRERQRSDGSNCETGKSNARAGSGPSKSEILGLCERYFRHSEPRSPEP